MSNLKQEQIKSFEHDLKIMEQEIVIILKKVKNETDDEIMGFYEQKLAMFLESKQKIKATIKKLKKELEEGAKEDVNNVDEK